MPRSRGVTLAGRTGYVAGCLVAVVAMVVSGFGYYVKNSVASIGGSHAIVGGPSVGAMNILLMGLESRTYWGGQPLPKSVEDAMHIGSVGGQATNTLIVIHIFAGGEKAVGFSIPRDDWVTFPQPYDGQSQGKIDQAYGLALAAKEDSLQGKGLTSGQVAYLGNEAGRRAEIGVVQALTGVRIDHFAELNLLGFYELAKVFNGITVCVKSWNNGQNLLDANSGFDAVADGYKLKKGGAQYLQLNPAQSLAFVRERDNLPNGDLDRTHRQQSVVDYVIWKLKHQGAFTDLGELSSLLTTAKQYLITDSGWNLLDFLPELGALSGDHLTFKTLPILRYETIDGQAANVVDVTSIKQLVHTAFYPPATPKRATAPATAGRSVTPTAGHSSSPTAGRTPSADPTPSASRTPSAPPSPGPEGGAVTVNANAPYGIPCVF